MGMVLLTTDNTGRRHNRLLSVSNTLFDTLCRLAGGQKRPFQKGSFQADTPFDPPLSWGSDPSAHSVGRSEVSCDRNRKLKKCNDAQRPCFGMVAREARREGSLPATTPQSSALTAPLRYGGRSRDDASVVYRVPCSPDKGSSFFLPSPMRRRMTFETF